jgi:hypothetical protein
MRMRKLFVVLAGLGVAGILVLYWPSQPNRITKENYDRIRLGMSCSEVEAILGPPGDYRTRLGDTKFHEGWQADLDEYDPTIATWRMPISGGSVIADWVGDTIRVQVYADDTRGVALSRAVERRRNEHALDDLLWRIKRKWRRWFPE